METKLTVSETNEVFARFMGLDWNSYERLKRNYESDWKELMPVCQQWYNLFKTEPFLENRQTETYREYLDLQDKLDCAMVKGYEIQPVYDQLLENITWYNQNSK